MVDLRDPDQKRAYVRALFDRIAHRYDRFTHWFSYGMDRGWKRELVAQLATVVPEGATVLDLACGTGDLGTAIAVRYPGTRVLGLDLSRPMLRTAKRSPGRLELCQADMIHLPFGDASVDAVLAGYAVRNAPDGRRALSEIARVLKPGGWMITLDFYQPQNRTWRALFVGYLAAVGSLYGWTWHRSPASYGYIAESLRLFVTPRAFSTLLAEQGFGVHLVREKLWGGIAIHLARKRG